MPAPMCSAALVAAKISGSICISLSSVVLSVNGQRRRHSRRALSMYVRDISFFCFSPFFIQNCFHVDVDFIDLRPAIGLGPSGVSSVPRFATVRCVAQNIEYCDDAHPSIQADTIKSA